MTRKQQRARYLEACSYQSSEWLWGCALDPSPYMAKRHIRWIRLALKMRGFPFA